MFDLTLNMFWLLVLNLGHSPLYRLLQKCLHIELLKHTLANQLFHTFYTQVIFGCTWHNLNKIGSALVGTKILRSTMPIRNVEFECWILSYSLLRMRLRIGQLWIEAFGNVECFSLNTNYHELTRNYIMNWIVGGYTSSPWPAQLEDTFLLLVPHTAACSGYGGDAITSYS